MNELHDRILNLLKTFDGMCREFGVDYYLTAGTLIGAIRHQGFIPWDDDADIIMTRENWNKFREHAIGNMPEGFRLTSQEIDPVIATTMDHFGEVGSAAIYRYDITNPEDTGIFIDLIVMDPVPNTPEARQEYIRALTIHTELCNLYYQYGLRAGINTEFPKYWAMAQEKGLAETFKEIDKIAFNYTEEESYFYVQRNAGAPHFWPKHLYGKPQYVPFEDTMLPVPQCPSEVLSIGFDDDWMQIPRGGSTKSTHEFCVRSLTIPSEVITSDFEAHSNHDEMMETFIERKKLWSEFTDKRFEADLLRDVPIAEMVRAIYKKKLDGVDVPKLVEDRDYERLEELFEYYLSLQCTDEFVGSSSLVGWMRWYRKCNPLLIDLGDDAFHGVLSLLLHNDKIASVGKLLKARRRVERELSDLVRQDELTYQAIKQMRIASDLGNWDEYESVLENYQHLSDVIPSFYRALVTTQIRKGGKDVLDLIEKGLAAYPEDDELAFEKAKILFARGDKSEALTIFDEIVARTNNGIVLLHMRKLVEAYLDSCGGDDAYERLLTDIRVCSGIDSEEQEEGAEELPPWRASAEVSELTEVTKRRFELLVEIDKICRDNGIEYFLGSSPLLQAYLEQRLIDQSCEFVVHMTQENALRFRDVFATLHMPHRFLHSLENDSDYHRFGIRYCDDTTVDTNVENLPYAVPRCVYVYISILRCNKKNPLLDRYQRFLEYGWEYRNVINLKDRKRRVCRDYTKLMIRLRGEQRVAKSLFNKLIDPKDLDTSFYFTKGFKSGHLDFDAAIFAGHGEVELEGHSFYCPKKVEEYLALRFGPHWMTNVIPEGKINPRVRLQSIDISFDELVAHLDQAGFDRADFREKQKEIRRLYEPLRKYAKQARGYWDLMETVGDRHILAEEYKGQKDELRTLYETGNYEELCVRLEHYVEAARLHRRWRHVTYFDEDIFAYLCAALDYKDEHDLVQTMREILDETPWEPLV